MNPFKHSLLAGLCCAVYLLGSHQVLAGSTQTTGAGSAVTTVNLSANFNGLTNFQDLSNYTEGGLSVTIPANGWLYYDPFDYYDLFDGHGDKTAFFYPNGGTNAWLTIHPTDPSLLMTGVEFLYGNGWESSGVTFFWQTLDGSTVVSSGSVADLALGTIVGISDPAGFTKLEISAGDPDSLDAIAIDDLKVQTLSGPSPVPDGGFTAAILGTALLGLAALRRKWGIS